MGVLADVLYLINIPRLLTPRRRAPIKNYIFMSVAFVTTLFFTLIYFTQMYAEDIILLMIVILALLFIFYSISSNRGDLEDEYIDREIIMTERKIAGTETKISDLKRQKDSASTIEGKRRLERELLKTEQEKLRTEVDRDRVFDKDLVQEISNEMKERDRKDLEELDKREKEYQKELNELTSTVDVEKDLSKTNRISALMSKQKNIQSIRNKKIGYASEKSNRIEDAVNGLKTMKTTHDEELVELNKDLEDQKNKLRKGRYLSDADRKTAEAEKTRLEKAIKLIEEDRELGDRKMKILREGRIDNLETINSYNKGATVLRTEAVANDGIMRLIQQKRLKKGATKADREVAIKAENLVKERDINQEVLEMGLALHRSKENENHLEDRWKSLQRNRKKDLELGRESRLVDEYKKQEDRDILAEEKTKTKVKTSLDKLVRDGNYGLDTDLGNKIDTALGDANYENALEDIITAQEAKVEGEISNAGNDKGKKEKLKAGKEKLREGIEKLIQKRKNLVENNRELFDARKKIEGLDGTNANLGADNPEGFYSKYAPNPSELKNIDTKIESAKTKFREESYQAVENAINGSYTNDPLVESSIKRALKRNANSDLPSASEGKKVIDLKTAVKERKDKLRKIEDYATLDYISDELGGKPSIGRNYEKKYEILKDSFLSKFDFIDSLKSKDLKDGDYLTKVRELKKKRDKLISDVNRFNKNKKILKRIDEMSLSEKTPQIEERAKRLEKENDSLKISIPISKDEIKVDIDSIQESIVKKIKTDKETIRESVKEDRENRGLEFSGKLNETLARLKEINKSLKDRNIPSIERKKLNSERIYLKARALELLKERNGAEKKAKAEEKEDEEKEDEEKDDEGKDEDEE